MPVICSYSLVKPHIDLLEGILKKIEEERKEDVKEEARTEPTTLPTTLKKEDAKAEVDKVGKKKEVDSQRNDCQNREADNKNTNDQ